MTVTPKTALLAVALLAALVLPAASTTGSLQPPNTSLGPTGPSAHDLHMAGRAPAPGTLWGPGLPLVGPVLPTDSSGEGSAPGAGLLDASAPKVTVQLQAVKKTVNVLGVPVEAWTFNGVVPGPIIRISEGTQLEIVLTNALDQAHSIHTHLRGNLLASDGSSDTAPLPIVPHQHNPLPAQQNPIGPYQPREDRDVADPGGSYTYTFYADTPGTFLYHCHVFVATEHISRGLFGLIVVYPKGWTWEELPKDELNGNTKARVTDAQGNPYFEDVVMISEITPGALPSPGAAVPGVPWYPSGVSTAGLTPPAAGKIHTANFRAWNDPYVVGPVRPNERVLLHVANIGDEMHDFHVHSTWFDVLDKISRTKASLWTADTLLLGPGDSYEVALTAGPAGYWFMHDHIVPEALVGMVPWLKVEGDPLPDTPPTVTVEEPIDGAVVAGHVLFKGLADDFNGRETVRSVEVMVDDGSWEPVQGLLTWRYVWDSTVLPDGPHVLTFRTWDGFTYSAEQPVGVTVVNHALGLLTGYDDGSAAAQATQPTTAKKAPGADGLAFVIAIGLGLGAVVALRRRPE